MAYEIIPTYLGGILSPKNAAANHQTVFFQLLSWILLLRSTCSTHFTLKCWFKSIINFLLKKRCKKTNLVGGWTTQLKNMLVKLDHLPQPNRGENKKYVWNHHLVINYCTITFVETKHSKGISKKLIFLYKQPVKNNHLKSHLEPDPHTWP